VEDNPSVLKPVGEALHIYFDNVVNEPLPKRWIDLINWLNEQEREQAEQCGAAPPPSVQG
jgi:hypothetical protein